MVFLVQDEDTLEHFALKRIYTRDRDALEKAKREVDIHQKFNHPNILQLFDSDVISSKHIPAAKEVLLLLPHYERGTLQEKIDQLIKAGDLLTETEALLYFIGICEGVKQFHRQGLCHRDIKPGNVLISDDNQPILMDFGSTADAVVQISSRFDALRLEEEAAQNTTATYRAPELYQVSSGSTIDHKVDVWALGCVLYTLAFLQSPFEYAINEQGGSLALAILNGKINFPQSTSARFSEDFKQLILMLLQVNPQERPSIDDILEHANTILQHSLH